MSSATVNENRGASSFSIWLLSQRSSRRLHQFARRAGQMFVGDDAHARPQGVVAGHQLADQIAESSARRRHWRARCAHSTACDSLVARASISPASTFCAAEFRVLASEPRGRGVGGEHESVETADNMTLHGDFARFSDFSFKHRVLS